MRILVFMRCCHRYSLKDSSPRQFPRLPRERYTPACNSNRDSRYVPNLYLMSCSSPVFTGIVRSSYGTHLLDHLAADGAGFAGGQVTVVTVGQVHANLPWCLFYIVNFQISIVSSEESVRTGKVGTAAWSERLPMNL